MIVYGGGIDLGSMANDAVVAVVAVETGVFLSHLQHLVVVKVRCILQGQGLPAANPYKAFCPHCTEIGN